MYLIYTDESGTNGNISSKFSLYGGLAVHESAILKFEMQIVEIIQEFLDVSNMLEIEIHFTEIFNFIFYNRKPTNKNKEKKFTESIYPKIKNKTKTDIIIFLDELLQLIQKANVSFLFCFINKEDEYHNNHYLGNKEISYNAYTFKGFINLLDNFLTKEKEMGLLIEDGFFNQLPKKLENLSLSCLISDDTIKNHPYVKEIVYKRVLAESLVWKNKFMNGFLASNTIAPLQYKFESNSFNIVDNINFVSSKDSIINQISDVILFMFRKILEYQNEPTKYSEIKEILENKQISSTLEFVIGNSVKPVTVSNSMIGTIDVLYTIKERFLMTEVDFIQLYK